MPYLSSKKPKNDVFIKRVNISSNVEDVFEYHTREGALERLIPPWSFLRVLKSNNDIENGSITILRINLGPLGIIGPSDSRGTVQSPIKLCLKISEKQGYPHIVNELLKNERCQQFDDNSLNCCSS